jgi:hypothetical protein
MVWETRTRLRRRQPGGAKMSQVDPWEKAADCARAVAASGRKHENMTLAEDKALLARFAKAAGAGELLNIHDLKAGYEKAIGHATSDSTVYNLHHVR